MLLYIVTNINCITIIIMMHGCVMLSSDVRSLLLCACADCKCDRVQFSND